MSYLRLAASASKSFIFGISENRLFAATMFDSIFYEYCLTHTKAVTTSDAF